MARDRQRSKQRQAERRAARQAERRAPGAGGPGPGERRPSDRASAPGDALPSDGPRPEAGDAAVAPAAGLGVAANSPDLADDAALAAGAPPEDVGRTDTVLESPPDLAPEEADDGATGAAARAAEREASRSRRPQELGEGHDRERGKLAAFLVAVWAELQRVQWPDRAALTTLTGVVLGFVVLVGLYLGALDAIFSRLIQALL